MMNELKNEVTELKETKSFKDYWAQTCWGCENEHLIGDDDGFPDRCIYCDTPLSEGGWRKVRRRKN